MAIFSDKIVSTKFIDPPNNMIIEVLYREGDTVIPYTLEVDFTADDFNDLLKEVTLEDIEQETSKALKAEYQAFEAIIQREVDARWAAEQDKVKAAYDDAEAYAQKVIQREYDKINQEYQKLERASGEINQEYQKLERASGEINQEYQKLELEYKKVDAYVELEKGKKFQEVQEEFQKAREDLQTRFNLAPSANVLEGKDIFAAIDQNNQNNDFVFNLKISILEDPIIAKSRDKKLKLAIRKSKSVLDLLKIYAEAKEAA